MWIKKLVHRQRNCAQKLLTLHCKHFELEVLIKKKWEKGQKYTCFYMSESVVVEDKWRLINQMSRMRTTTKPEYYCRTWHLRKGWGAFCLVFWRKGKGEILLLGMVIWWRATEETELDSSEIHSESTGGNGCKLQERKFQLGVREIIFTMRASQAFDQVSRETVKSSSVEIFKAELGKALSNLISIGHTLSEELDKMVSRDSFKATWFQVY